MSTTNEQKCGHPSIFIVLLASTVTGLVILIGLITYMRWTETNQLQGDVCAEMLHQHDETIAHLKIVRGYNEFWDQLVGVDVLVHRIPGDEQMGDRVVMTARSVWGEWDVDWDNLYDNCPEAFSGTGQ